MAEINPNEWIWRVKDIVLGEPSKWTDGIQFDKVQSLFNKAYYDVMEGCIGPSRSGTLHDSWVKTFKGQVEKKTQGYKESADNHPHTVMHIVDETFNGNNAPDKFDYLTTHAPGVRSGSGSWSKDGSYWGFIGRYGCDSDGTWKQWGCFRWKPK